MDCRWKWYCKDICYTLHLTMHLKPPNVIKCKHARETQSVKLIITCGAWIKSPSLPLSYEKMHQDEKWKYRETVILSFHGLLQSINFSCCFFKRIYYMYYQYIKLIALGEFSAWHFWLKREVFWHITWYHTTGILVYSWDV